MDSAEVSDLSYNNFSPIINHDPVIPAELGEAAE